MGEGSQSGVGHRCQSKEALSRAASMFSEAVCCLITHCGSHLPQTSEFTCLGQGHSILASMPWIWIVWEYTTQMRTQTQTHTIEHSLEDNLLTCIHSLE